MYFSFSFTNIGQLVIQRKLVVSPFKLCLFEHFFMIFVLCVVERFDDTLFIILDATIETSQATSLVIVLLCWKAHNDKPIGDLKRELYSQKLRSMMFWKWACSNTWIPIKAGWFVKEIPTPHEYNLFLKEQLFLKHYSRWKLRIEFKGELAEMILYFHYNNT